MMRRRSFYGEPVRKARRRHDRAPRSAPTAKTG